MNYADYLRRRLASPSNGVITDENLFKSTKNGGTFEVTYQVFDPLVTLRIGFGRDSLLGHSPVGYAQGVSTIVGAGWELLDQGADMVVVTLNGFAWTCSKELDITDEYLSFVLATLTDQVCLSANGGVVHWLYVGNQRPRRAWFNSTGNAAHRNAYLASLNRYLSAALGTVVQIGERHQPSKACTYKHDGPTVTSLGNFTRWGCHSGTVKQLGVLLKIHQLETLLEHQALTRNAPGEPTVVISIALGDVSYRFPLYADYPPSRQCLTAVEEQLLQVLRSVRKKVAISIEDLYAQEVRLDII